MATITLADLRAALAHGGDPSDLLDPDGFWGFYDYMLATHGPDFTMTVQDVADAIATHRNNL